MGFIFSKSSNPSIDSEVLDIQTVEQLLLQPDITINTMFWRKTAHGMEKTTFLNTAIREGNADLIDGLIAQGVSLKSEAAEFELRIIDIMIPKNYLERTVRKLVSLGASLDFRDSKSGATALFHASLYFDARIAEFLIKSGADVNMELTKSGYYNGYSPLQYYAERGNVKMTKLILSKGGNVNHKSADGLRPLICAAQRGHLEVVKLLINFGADVNIVYPKNSNVVTLLHAALLSRKVEVLEFFCSLDEAATDINALMKKKNESVLQYELNDLFYSNEVVNFLLDAGFDVNAENANGELAIEYIVRGQDIEKNDLVIKKHLLKLISADLPVCKKNKDAIGDLENFAAEYCQEVQILKNSKIGDANITFYNVLHVSTHKLALKMKQYHVKFSGINCRKELGEVFPLYGGMLAYKLAKVQRRMALVDNAEEELVEIFNWLKLPHVFLRELFYYLDNCDLKKIHCKKSMV